MRKSNIIWRLLGDPLDNLSMEANGSVSKRREVECDQDMRRDSMPLQKRVFFLPC